jgi:hypothetical protein
MVKGLESEGVRAYGELEENRKESVVTLSHLEATSETVKFPVRTEVFSTQHLQTDQRFSLRGHSYPD